MPSGDGNVLTVHTNDGTERFRIDSSGNVKVGSACTISPDGDVFFTGVTTATTFTGAHSGSGANLTALPAAQVTGTLPAISGANLTNLTAGNLTGALPAISGANLTGIAATDNVRTGILDVAGIATFRDNVNVSNLNGGQLAGRRNLVINGDFRIAQRGTSSTATSGYNTVDRWTNEHGSTDEAPTFTTFGIGAPSSPYHLPTTGDHPYREGLRTGWGVQNGNQTSGAGADDNIIMGYAFEAQDIATCGWDYTNPNSFITLSFWIKSSVSQEFFGQILTQDGSVYNYPFGTGSLTAFTWKKVTKTIPGNANLQIDNDTGVGLRFYFWPFAGTNLTGSVTQDAWGAVNYSTRVPDNTTTWYTTNDASVQIAGVQLEVGSQATPFEHRPYGEELKLCQRYFCKAAEKGGSDHSMGMGANYNSSTSFINIIFPVTMRTTPTLDQITGTNYYRLFSNGGYETFDSFNSLDTATATPERCELRKESISITAGAASFARYQNSNAEIRFTAEL